MTFKVAFMAIRKVSNHPWKERGNAEGMHCIVKGYKCHIDIEGHQSKTTCNYRLLKSMVDTEELLIALISSLSPVTKIFLLSVLAFSPAGLFIRCFWLAPTCHTGYLSPCANSERNRGGTSFPRCHKLVCLNIRHFCIICLIWNRILSFKQWCLQFFTPVFLFICLKLSYFPGTGWEFASTVVKKIWVINFPEE